LSPLAGKGDFFHDGRFATLSDVVDHYNSTFGLVLSDREG
jgi:cytochrome c peroxidase